MSARVLPRALTQLSPTLHALYVYKRHSNAKYLIKMSELEEEVLLDLEFEVDEHSSTTSDSGTGSDSDDDDEGVGGMEKREQFGEDGVDAGAGQVIVYQRASWLSCQLPLSSPGPAQLAIDLPCTL